MCTFLSDIMLALEALSTEKVGVTIVSFGNSEVTDKRYSKANPLILFGCANIQPLGKIL